MSLVDIKYVWHRRITPGDFFNIERAPTVGSQGGGGQRFIDIPGSVRKGLLTMLGLEAPANAKGDWPPGMVDAKVIGTPTISGELRFVANRSNDTRYRIRNQNRQAAVNDRHPAWTLTHGFPRAPDEVETRGDAAKNMQGGLRIFLVKSLNSDYYAGFTTGATMPASWPVGAGFEALFDQSSPGGLMTIHTPDIPQVVYRILEAWKRQPNVLLYGPTGTG